MFSQAGWWLACTKRRNVNSLFTNPLMGSHLRVKGKVSTVADTLGEMGENQMFWGLLNAGSELIRIPGDWKKHCGLPVKAGA